MKKLFALLLALVMVFGLGVTAYAEDSTAAMDELIAAAKEEGTLVVYGSCEEEYLAAACENFQKLYGIKTDYQRLSTGEVPAKIEEENGKPSADAFHRRGSREDRGRERQALCRRLVRRHQQPL